MENTALEINTVPTPATPDWEMSRKDWAAVIGALLVRSSQFLIYRSQMRRCEKIQGSLGLDFVESGWISTSYLIAEIIVIPLTAYFSKVFGIRNYILANTVLFMISSALCGLAWNLGSLIAFGRHVKKQ